MNTKDQIFRLLNYKNLLYRLQSLGFVKVFSDNIADSLNISASLVRKDFGAFEIRGNQKGGYHIESVLNKISEVLSNNEIQRVIIVGVGRIGEALMDFENQSSNQEIKIVAGFEINQKKINPDAEIPVLPINEMTDFIYENNIRIAIVAVPDLAANQTFETLRNANIKGILNFSSIKLNSTDTLKVNNINIEHELENLIYFVNQINIRNQKVV